MFFRPKDCLVVRFGVPSSGKRRERKERRCAISDLSGALKQQGLDMRYASFSTQALRVCVRHSGHHRKEAVERVIHAAQHSVPRFRELEAPTHERMTARAMSEWIEENMAKALVQGFVYYAPSHYGCGEEVHTMEEQSTGRSR